MSQPIEVNILMADGIFAKQGLVEKAGTIIPQHSHKWDHATFVSAGAMRVFCDGRLIGDFRAPRGLTIPAGTKHTFITLEDNTVFSCIHRIDRTGEIDVAEEHQFEGVL